MTNKTLLTLLLVGTIGFLGCGRREYSEVMHEEGKVTDIEYTPGHSEEDIGSVVIPIGDGGLGMSTDGQIGTMGSITTHEEHIPSKYSVTIKSENKTFRLNGQGGQKVYNKLEEGEKVDVTYREVYRAFYKDTNNDGKKELVKRKLINYEFLDANPSENQEK